MTARYHYDRRNQRIYERDVRDPDVGERSLADRGRDEVVDRDRGYDPVTGDGGDGRTIVDKTVDEVRSWFGKEKDDTAERVDEPARRPAERSITELRVSDIMSRDVMCVRPDDSIQRAARTMQDGECGAVPVIDSAGRLVGMITDRDITVRLVARAIDVARARVEDAMTDEAFACRLGDSLVDCMRAMSHHQVRRVPVVDDRDQVIGIVSQSDLARHAGEHLGTGERRAMADVLCAVSAPSQSAHR